MVSHPPRVSKGASRPELIRAQKIVYGGPGSRFIQRGGVPATRHFNHLQVWFAAAHVLYTFPGENIGAFTPYNQYGK